MHGMKACFLAVLAVGVSLHSPITGPAGSNSLSMQSTVIGTCKVTTPPGLLNFGLDRPLGQKQRHDLHDVRNKMH